MQCTPHAFAKACRDQLPVRGITVLCHFYKNDLMPVIILCKNDKDLVTVYNGIFFKYDKHPVTFELYLLLTQEGSNDTHV